MQRERPQLDILGHLHDFFKFLLGWPLKDVAADCVVLAVRLYLGITNKCYSFGDQHLIEATFVIVAISSRRVR